MAGPAVYPTTPPATAPTGPPTIAPATAPIAPSPSRSCAPAKVGAMNSPAAIIVMVKTVLMALFPRLVQDNNAKFDIWFHWTIRATYIVFHLWRADDQSYCYTHPEVAVLSDAATRVSGPRLPL